MNFKPILFSTPMVHALLSGTKTQTRRVAKPQPIQKEQGLQFDEPGCKLSNGILRWHGKDCPHTDSPYGQIGDILWVRETIYQNGELGLEYVADGEDIDEDLIPQDFNVRVDKLGHYKHCKIPSIYMEKWACRLFLKIKSVRMERLHDISETDAVAEGIHSEPWALDPEVTLYRNYTEGGEFYSFSTYGHNFGKEEHTAAVASYCTLWKDINGVDSWNSNPWVWVIEFEQIEKPKNFV